MKKVSLKKSMTICLVSALIASSMCTMAFAVEPSDTVTDNSVVVSEQSDEISVVSEVSKEESKVESVTENSVAESSVEDSGGKEESSKQVSTVEESSKVEEVSVPELQGEQTIYFTVNFGGSFGKAHASMELGYIDYSNVRITVYTYDKSKVLGTFKITDDMYYGEVDNSFTKCFSVKVPEWKKGSKYKVVFENLPSIYESDNQECIVEYAENIGYKKGTTIVDKVIIYGISEDTSLAIKLNRRKFNTLFFTYDMQGKSVSNAEVFIEGYDDNDNLIYENIVKSNKDGLVMATIDNDSVTSIVAGIENVVNNEIMGGNNKFLFDYETATNFSTAKFVLQTNTKYDEILVDQNGEPLKDVFDVPFKLTYQNNDKVDMSLFNWSKVDIGIYTGKDLFYTFVLDKDTLSSTVPLTDGSKYTIAPLNNVDYNLNIDSKTLSVNKSASVNIIATPQLTLKVINKENGVNKNVRFSIDGKEYNGAEFYSFAVNRGTGFMVTNLDTNEIFSVSIGAYKETVLNIATGDIEKDGYLGSSSSNISNGENSQQVEDVNVPKTGDIILTVVIVILICIALFGTGFIYFRKKGSIYNEHKK